MHNQQIAQEFVGAHLTRKVAKKWVQDAVKEHADWQGSLKGWVLKPSGAALAASAAAAAPGVEAAVAPTPGAVPAPAAAAVAAAEAAVGEAAGAAAVAPASGGVEPTPAATKPSVGGGGGIERFFKKVSHLALPPGAATWLWQPSLLQ